MMTEPTNSIALPFWEIYINHKCQITNMNNYINITYINL